MTLSIIFGIIILVGVGLKVSLWWKNRHLEWHEHQWHGLDFLGSIIIVVFTVVFIVNFLVWLPSKKDSEIKYHQLVQEKITIEQMLETDKNIDRFLLNERVIEYNNTVIMRQTNSKRFVYREYYSKDVDWDALELIAWSKGD